MHRAKFVDHTLIQKLRHYIIPNTRKFSSGFESFKMATGQEHTPRELHIPIPYGFIAAKAWGKENGEPILALHGWQDNAGTFDRLVPLLSSDLHIIAIDAPGHGLSSHKPLGTFYYYMEMLLDIKRVVDYLKWDTFSIMGHSLGGTLALMYSSVFPEAVKNVILLDIIKPASRDMNKLPDVTRPGIFGMLDVERKMLNPAPVYTPKEAKDRLIAGLYNEVTPEAADSLLIRGCQPSKCGNGVVFCRDIRVKMSQDLMKFSHEDLKAYLRRMRCNLLIIVGKSSMVFRIATPAVAEEFLELYKEVCNSYQLIEVDGNHFVHLNNPDRVAPHIDSFFKMQGHKTCKL